MSNPVDNETFNNDWYNSGASKLKMLLWYFINVLFFLNPLNPISSIKVFFLRLFGAKIGKGVLIKPSVNIKYPWKLTIGDHTWLGEKVWIDNLGKVDIGSNVCISQGALILCGNHDYRSSKFELIVGDIIIENGCWIGANATVCPGVVMFSHSVLSVNSVASKDCQPYSINKGNPAENIRAREICR
ncbi:MAG: WcaF family extracellular polysaccharide biosynthesis acetyltransferase [Bacteroidia bacterium]